MGNPCLEGNYRPVRDEVTVTELPVTGHIPDHLDGRYVRNGPNPIQEPDADSYHWFLGDGMVHGVRIRDGRAEWYRNRWIRSAPAARDLGEPKRPRPLHVGPDFTTNTNVIGHAGRTYALVEGSTTPYELTEQLDTVGPCDFDGTLPGAYSAHPHHDPVTGELHAVSYSIAWGNRVRYSVLGTDGRIRHTVDIPVTGSPMMHDFSLTENHVIFYDLPVTLDPEAGARVFPRPFTRPGRFLLERLAGRVPTPDPVLALIGRWWGKGNRSAHWSLPYAWNPDYPARVGVMPREGRAKDLRWYDVEPCYVFHALNAFEDGDTLVLDVIRHPKIFDRNRLGPYEGTATLDRWTLDRTSGKLTEDRFDDRSQEFPRIDERLLGRRHRYGYSIGVQPGTEVPSDSVFKHDLVSGRTTVRALESGRGAGEFAFIPAGPDAEEDHGVLVGFVHNADTDRSDLEMLDAQTLETVATIHLPVRVPYGFHGNWIPC